MNGLSRSALLAWIATFALGAFGCARAHHDGVRAADDERERGDGTTRDPVGADDEEGDVEDDASPVASAPTPVRGAPAPAVSRPVAPPPMDEPSTGELMADLFAEYQRDASLRCPCHVVAGVYATLEECLDSNIRQRPQVNDCLDQNVPSEPLKELHSWVRCITEIKREHNACLEREESCEAEASCRIDTARCRFPNAARVTMAINLCPQAISIGP